MTVRPRPTKAAREQGRHGARDNGSREQGAPAERRTQLGDGRDFEEQEEDEAEGAEGADAAVAHDREPMLGIATDETVEAVREAVEMQASGYELPGGDHEERSQQRRKDGRHHALAGGERASEAQAHDGNHGAARPRAPVRILAPGHGTM